jgi:MIP family channel proteins
MAVAGEGNWQLQVSLAFGLAITTLAYAIGHYSGGQINCAVTLGLCIHGSCSWAQGALNFLAQMCGSVLGALILYVIFGQANDKTGGLGSNGVQKGYSPWGALLAEVVMTFLLVFVVLETATNPATKANVVNAPIAIGFAVFLAHCMLIPVTGCSINPTRSFGPILVNCMFYKKETEEVKEDVSEADDTEKKMPVLAEQCIFWIGPLLGAAIAPGVMAILH